jgi:hypothetical protein
MEKIKIKTIIEIVGMPKEHVEKTIQKVIDIIKEKKNFELIDSKIAETKEIKGLWSTFGEFEINFPNLGDLEDFCFDFMPSSVEIISPEKLNIPSSEVENFLNDVLAKLHQYDMAMKKIILQQRKEQKEKKETPSS